MEKEWQKVQVTNVPKSRCWERTEAKFANGISFNWRRCWLSLNLTKLSYQALINSSSSSQFQHPIASPSATLVAHALYLECRCADWSAFYEFSSQVMTWSKVSSVEPLILEKNEAFISFHKLSISMGNLMFGKPWNPWILHDPMTHPWLRALGDLCIKVQLWHGQLAQRCTKMHKVYQSFTKSSWSSCLFCRYS